MKEKKKEMMKENQGRRERENACRSKSHVGGPRKGRNKGSKIILTSIQWQIESKGMHRLD